MSVVRIASRYAKSLIDLAVERGELEKVFEDIQYFNAVAENRDFAMLVKSPIINADKKAKVFKALFEGKLSQLTNNFIDIVLRKGREAYLLDISEEFVRQYREIKHISIVTLTTAKELGNGTVAKITEALKSSAKTDHNIQLTTAVDPSLIAGYVLEFDNNRYDASVAYKLELLRKEFNKNEYIKNL